MVHAVYSMNPASNFVYSGNILEIWKIRNHILMFLIFIKLITIDEWNILNLCLTLGFKFFYLCDLLFNKCMKCNGTNEEMFYNLSFFSSSDLGFESIKFMFAVFGWYFALGSGSRKSKCCGSNGSGSWS